MIRLLRVLICASVVISSYACTSSGVNGNATSLTGYWVVASAYRDKAETKLLADVFFLFNGDGTMRSNMPHSGEALTAYTVSGDQLVQQGNTPISYDIIRHTDSTLVLGFDANNTRFELHLVLSEQPELLNPDAEEVDTLH